MTDLDLDKEFNDETTCTYYNCGDDGTCILPAACIR